jgi:PKD repeat protein
MDPVRCLAVSPDGKFLATGSGDGIRFWDLGSGELVRTQLSEGASIYALAFSPDGRYLAAGYGDGKVVLWEATKVVQIRTLFAHQGAVYSLAFSSDSQFLATGGADGRVRVWEVAAGKALCTLAGHSSSVRAVSFSPDRTQLVSGSDDRVALVWDTARLFGIVANRLPIAEFTWSILAPKGARSLVVPRAGDWVEFDASASRDPDGKIVKYEWDWDGDGKFEESTKEEKVTRRFQAAGTYNIVLRVTDERGASATCAKTIAVAENEAPVPQFTFAPVQPEAGQTVRFDASLSYDPDGVISEYLWSFGDGTTGSGQVVSHVYADGGTFVVTLTVIDDSGAKASWPKEVPVKDIKAPPQPLMLVVTPNSWTNINTFRVEWVDPPDPSGIAAAWYKLGSAPVSPTDGTRVEGKPLIVSAGAEGGQKIFLWLEDGAGNKDHSSAAEATLYYDATPPTGALLVNNGEERTVIGLVTLSVSVKDEGGSGVYEMRFSNDAQSWSPWEPIAELRQGWDLSQFGGEDSPGVKTVYAQFKDQAGNVSTTVSDTIVFQPSLEPHASFVFSPDRPTILDIVQFTDLSRDTDGTIVSWEWDFGDGEKAWEKDPKHQYQKKGEFTVTLVVTDNDGNKATTTQLLRVVNCVPSALFSYSPAVPAVGEAVIFDASASVDPDGRIVSFKWDFSGDGIADVEGNQVTWEFKNEGEFVIELLVVDDEGEMGKIKKKVVVGGPLEPHNVWAVVIGIGAYRDPRIRQLLFPKHDAEEFYRWLVEDARIPRTQVRLFLDSEATLVNMRAAISWLAQNIREGDLGIFYFAGHGGQGEDLPPKDEEDDRDEYFVLYDTLSYALEATAFRDDDFGTFLSQLPARANVLVVFDSCYAGGAARGDRGLPPVGRPIGGTIDIWRDFDLEGKIVLAAAKEDQESYEDEDLQHGVFTYFLLKGVRGEADRDNDGRITIEELGKYVAEQVSTYVFRKKGSRQEPILAGRGKSNVVVGLVNRPPVADFTFSPPSPFPGKAISFIDASKDDGEIVQWSWEFGDGGVSAERNPFHAFMQTGSYKVTLRVIDNGGLTATVTKEVKISSWGVVTIVLGDRVLISLGAENGVKVGDRFKVGRRLDLPDGESVFEERALIEVTDVVSSERSVCRILQQILPIERGDMLLPVEEFGK